MSAQLSIRQSLCTNFATQAVETWNFLARGDHYNLLPGEETITDVNLLDLRERLDGLVYTEKYSRYREGVETGADWEWWISDRHGWLGLRIQAKKLDPQTGRYEALVNDPAKAIEQADMLIEAAAAGPERRYALYCFYNCWWQGAPDPPCNAGMTDPRVYGCALAPATVVRDLIVRGAAGFDDFAPHSIPWSCLFCGADTSSDSRLLASGAKAALDRWLFSDHPDERGRIEVEVPEYVERLWRVSTQMRADEVDKDIVPALTHVLLTTGLIPPT